MRSRLAHVLVASGLVAACRFEADYTDGTFRCSDGVCPDGLVCNAAQVCEEPGAPDAALDGAPPDAYDHALTCADPGPIPREIAFEHAASTDGGLMQIASMCNNGVYNGFERVYRVVIEAGDVLDLSIGGGLDAYVLASCAAGTVACESGDAATDGFPLQLTGLAPGDYFVVVDELTPDGGQAYTLTAHLGP